MGQWHKTNNFWGDRRWKVPVTPSWREIWRHGGCIILDRLGPNCFSSYPPLVTTGARVLFFRIFPSVAPRFCPSVGLSCKMVQFTSNRPKYSSMVSLVPLHVAGWKIKGQCQKCQNKKNYFFAVTPTQIVLLTSGKDQMVLQRSLYPLINGSSRSRMP